MIHKAHEKIKKIGMGNSLSAEESKMKSNIQAALARQLQDLSGQFRRSQRDYLNRKYFGSIALIPVDSTDGQDS